MAVISPAYMRAAAQNRPAAFVSKCQMALSSRFANAATGSFRPQVAANNAFRPAAANVNRAPVRRTAVPTLRAA